MKDPDPPPTGSPKPKTVDPFRELLTKVMQTPKAEIDKREAEYQRRQAKKPKRGPKPK